MASITSFPLALPACFADELQLEKTQTVESGEPDFIAAMQREAIEQNVAPWGHWGVRPDKYSDWRATLIV